MSPLGDYGDLRTSELRKASGTESMCKSGYYLYNMFFLYLLSSCFSNFLLTFSLLKYISLAFCLLSYTGRGTESRTWAEAGLPHSDSCPSNPNTHPLMVCKSPRLLLKATPLGLCINQPTPETLKEWWKKLAGRTVLMICQAPSGFVTFPSLSIYPPYYKRIIFLIRTVSSLHKILPLRCSQTA